MDYEIGRAIELILLHDVKQDWVSTEFRTDHIAVCARLYREVDFYTELETAREWLISHIDESVFRP